MIRMSVRPLTLVLTLAAATAVPLACQQGESHLHQFEVVTVAEGFENPWSMAWLPNGDMLVTERSGSLRVVRDGRLLPDPVSGVPEVFARNQGGLLDVVPHPDFDSNRWLYITYSKPDASGERGTTALVRGRFENDALTEVEELFEAEAWGGGGNHFGSRIVFDGDGHVFISVGDRGARPDPRTLPQHAAQDRTDHRGTVIRLHEDGRVPSDNPFVDTDGVLPEIWSYGHRNPQGMAIDPATGALWANEHGPQGGDEMNHVRPGLNYGWPVIGYGLQYGGSVIHSTAEMEGMEQPAHYWVPSIGTSGLLFYTGEAFPNWQGDAFVGGLSGTQLARLTIDGGVVIGEETLLEGIGRIRDVRQGPDGFIYLAIDARRGGETPIVRLEPRGN